jgi:hypothetical protein
VLEVICLFVLMLILLGVSILLITISFFLKDPYQTLQKDIDQLSIQQYQELYKIKKKLKLLEEELLLDEIDLDYSPQTKESNPFQENSNSSIHAIIKNQVWALASQGVPLDQIASQSSLSILQVQQIVNEGSKRGIPHE